VRALVVAVAMIAVLAVTTRSDSALRCPTGSAVGFASIEPEPPFLVGTIPSRFTGNARYFSRRFNCRSRSVQVRRLDLGVYEVRFPELQPRTVVATATSDEGVAASAMPVSDGTVRITLRGPLSGRDVASLRDVPFSIVVF
jgi:hypothetical protein